MAIITYGSGNIYGTGVAYGEDTGTNIVSISASLSTISTLASQLETEKKFSGSLTCSSTLSTALREVERISGSISSSLNVSPRLSKFFTISSSIFSSAGIIGRATYTKNVSGSITNTSSIDNTSLKSTIGLTGTFPPEALLAGNSAVHWSLDTYSMIQYGRARIFGTDLTYGEHQSVFVVVTVVSANINRHYQIEGFLDSSSSLGLISEVLLEGSIGGVSNIGGKIVGLVSLAPMYLFHVNAGTIIEGNLGGVRSALGDCIARSNIEGVGSVLRTISSVITAVSSTDALLLRFKLLEVQLNAISSILGAVKLGKNLLGTAEDSTIVTGAIKIDWALDSEISSQATTSGSLKVLRHLIASLNAISSTLAQMLSVDLMQSEITATSTISGLLIPLKDSAGAISAQSALSTTCNVHWDLIPKSQIQYGHSLLYGNGWEYGQRTAILAMLFLDSRVRASYILAGEIQAAAFLVMRPSPLIEGIITATSQIGADLDCFKKLSGYAWAFSLIEGDLKKLLLQLGTIEGQSSTDSFLKVFKRISSVIDGISIISEPDLIKLRLLYGDIAALSNVEALMLRLKLMLGSIIAAQSVFGVVERFDPISILASFDERDVIFQILNRSDFDFAVVDDSGSTLSLTQIDATPSIFDLDVSIAAVA